MKTLKKILLTPYWILLVFTQSKSFRTPVIGSRILNILGLHLFRIMMARSIYRFRQGLMFFLVSAADRKFFLKNGYLIIENFLTDKEFADITKEITDYHGMLREINEGSTITKRLLLSSENAGLFPAFQRLRKNPRFRNLLKYTSGSNEFPFCSVESLHHGKAESSGDPQKNLHKDTFHPTVKAWLFLTDVGEENGPLNYIPGSHRLSRSRMKWEYQESVQRSDRRGNHPGAPPQGGAFRPDDDAKGAMDLPEPVAFTVNKNSLIIADTMGLHRRGMGKDGASRLALWASSRVNPFNPFPGFCVNFVERLRDRIYQSYLLKNQGKSGKFVNGTFDR